MADTVGGVKRKKYTESLVSMSLSRQNILIFWMFLPRSLAGVASSANLTTRSFDARDPSGVDGTECNTTLYYKWYNTPHSGAFREDLIDFWLFSDAELTNGQALEVVSSTCKDMMKTLSLDRAGRNGPIAEKYIYDVMCSDECVLSDSLRDEAMLVTGCTCLQLSTQPSELTYHMPGDWCRTNSGRCVDRHWSLSLFVSLQLPTKIVPKQVTRG